MKYLSEPKDQTYVIENLGKEKKKKNETSEYIIPQT